MAIRIHKEVASAIEALFFSLLANFHYLNEELLEMAWYLLLPLSNL